MGPKKTDNKGKGKAPDTKTPSPPKANPQKRGASGSPQSASPRPGQAPAAQRQATSGSAVPGSSSQPRLSVNMLLNPKSPSPAVGQPPAPQVHRQSSISSLRSTGSASSITSRAPPSFLAQAGLQKPPQAGPLAGQSAPQPQGAGRGSRGTPPPKQQTVPLSAILNDPSRANSPRQTVAAPPPRQNTGGSAAPARQQIAPLPRVLGPPAVPIQIQNTRGSVRSNTSASGLVPSGSGSKGGFVAPRQNPYTPANMGYNPDPSVSSSSKGKGRATTPVASTTSQSTVQSARPTTAASIPTTTRPGLVRYPWAAAAEKAHQAIGLGLPPNAKVWYCSRCLRNKWTINGYPQFNLESDTQCRRKVPAKSWYCMKPLDVPDGAIVQEAKDQPPDWIAKMPPNMQCPKVPWGPKHGPWGSYKYFKNLPGGVWPSWRCCLCKKTKGASLVYTTGKCSVHDRHAPCTNCEIVP
jgi:hypothetical protein